MTDIHAIVEAVEKRFVFLFTKKFRILNFESSDAFGNWVVLIQSAELKIKLFEDRGEIFIRFAPAWVDGWDNVKFFDLDILIGYLSKDLSYRIFQELPQDIDIQMEKLAKLTEANYDNILSLFEKDDYTKIEKELIEFRKRQIDQFKKSLYQ